MVVWKKLGEVCQVLNGFAFKSSEYVTEGIRIIRISDVQNGYISDKDRVYYPIEKLSEYERYLLNNGDLVMSLTGNPGRVAFIRKESFALNQRVACLRAKTISNSYLFYLFNCKEFESTAFANSTGGAQKNLSTTWLNNFPVPIPSLEEQNRIVGILDTFTSAIDNLKEQIAQRRKQHEYYRDQLLDLEGKPGVEMKTLPEISDNRDRVRKPITSSKRKAGNYPYYGASGIVDYVDGYIFDGDYLLISEDGANLVARSTPIAFSITGKNWVNNHAHVLQFKDKATQKYVEIYLNMIDLEPWINGAAQPKLNQDNLNKISIPLPPLSEQQRIVSILDAFEASIQNLEAQLKEREKQYEYYRNKLLTFE